MTNLPPCENDDNIESTEGVQNLNSKEIRVSSFLNFPNSRLQVS